MEDVLRFDHVLQGSGLRRSSNLTLSRLHCLSAVNRLRSITWKKEMLQETTEEPVTTVSATKNKTCVKRSQAVS